MIIIKVACGEIKVPAAIRAIPKTRIIPTLSCKVRYFTVQYSTVHHSTAAAAYLQKQITADILL